MVFALKKLYQSGWSEKTNVTQFIINNSHIKYNTSCTHDTTIYHVS